MNLVAPSGIDPDYVSILLVQFIQWCYDNAVNIWIPKHAVLAYRNFVPGLRQALHRPWDALRSWKALLPLSHRVPLPEIVLRATFGFMLDYALSYPGGALRWIAGAILFRLAFFGLLRPSEFSQLKACDIQVASPVGSSKVILVAIRDPKNRNAMGRAQFVCVREPGLVAWLEWLVSGLPSNCKLWPGSHSQLVASWKEVIAGLGLGNINFTLGSFRPGGTTYYYICGKEIAYIKHLGRWASESSMACYVQESMAALVWSKVEPSVEISLIDWVEASGFVWSAPPTVPWQKVFSRSRQLSSIRQSMTKPLKFKNSRLASKKLASSRLPAQHLVMAPFSSQTP